MTILLAPMEGLLDFVLRDILTRVGGVDRCVSEFIRINDTLLPDRVFIRVVPELLNGGRTYAGVPVRAQLLGSDPVCLAENAACLAALGPDGIDLNFGCPAKVVNRHGGGAKLLDDPELLMTIVSAVRRAVPPHMPVSAKMRLGFDDDSRAVECALAMKRGVRASWLSTPAPRPTPTDHRLTGSAWQTYARQCESPWWPMAKYGQCRTPCAVAKYPAATV
jgi:tRNA-dihydrouridine synthase C